MKLLFWVTRNFSNLCLHQKTLNISLSYRVDTGPVNPFVDSIGIKSKSEGERNTRAHGGPKQRL